MIFRHNIFSDPAPVNKKALFIIFMCLFILSSIIALNFINNGRIVVKHVSVTITALPKNLENFRILHISDLHGKEFGASQSTISTMLRQQHYNAVCITGDVCRPDGDYDAFIKLIDLFSVPVYFVAGDEDPDPIAAVSQQSENVKAQYILEAEEHGAIYLDHPEKIQIGTYSVWFVPENLFGLDIDAARLAYQIQWNDIVSKNAQLTPEAEAQLHVIAYKLNNLDLIENVMDTMNDEDVRIAVTHYPLSNETIVTLQQWSGTEKDPFIRNSDLILAGHYAGGQIRIPFIGPLKAPFSLGGAWFPGDQEITGLSTLQGITQYISPGLGSSSVYPIRLRLFNTPSVTILTLTSALL